MCLLVVDSKLTANCTISLPKISFLREKHRIFKSTKPVHFIFWKKDRCCSIFEKNEWHRSEIYCPNHPFSGKWMQYAFKCLFWLRNRIQRRSFWMLGKITFLYVTSKWIHFREIREKCSQKGWFWMKMGRKKKILTMRIFVALWEKNRVSEKGSKVDCSKLRFCGHKIGAEPVV